MFSTILGLLQSLNNVYIKIKTPSLLVCGVFPFWSWGLVGMQEKEKACEHVICLSSQEEPSGRPWIEAHPEHWGGPGNSTAKTRR